MPGFSRPRHRYPLLPAALFLAFCLPAIAFALEPSEVLVIVNATVPEGIELSSYYMKTARDTGREPRTGDGQGPGDGQPGRLR